MKEVLAADGLQVQFASFAKDVGTGVALKTEMSEAGMSVVSNDGVPFIPS